MAVQCVGCGAYTIRSTWVDGRGHLCPTCAAVSLDVAWAEAVPLVPKGWIGPNFGRNSDGSAWAVAYKDAKYVRAEGAFDTPAAALRALTAKLRERADR